MWLEYYLPAFFNLQEAYNFWAKKQRARVEDERKKNILAPLEKPHYWGIKRPCLEYAYLEQFNRDNVDVVDIKDNAIKGFDETGILLEDGTHYDFDVICIATGFDVVTGMITFIKSTASLLMASRRHDCHGSQRHLWQHT